MHFKDNHDSFTAGRPRSLRYGNQTFDNQKCLRKWEKTKECCMIFSTLVAISCFGFECSVLCYTQALLVVCKTGCIITVASSLSYHGD